MIRYDNICTPGNSFWSKIKLGHVGERLGHVVTVPDLQKLFTYNYRLKFIEAQMERAT